MSGYNNGAGPGGSSAGNDRVLHPYQSAHVDLQQTYAGVGGNNTNRPPRHNFAANRFVKCADQDFNPASRPIPSSALNAYSFPFSPRASNTSPTSLASPISPHTINLMEQQHQQQHSSFHQKSFQNNKLMTSSHQPDYRTNLWINNNNTSSLSGNLDDNNMSGYNTQQQLSYSNTISSSQPTIVSSAASDVDMSLEKNGTNFSLFSWLNKGGDGSVSVVSNNVSEMTGGLGMDMNLSNSNWLQHPSGIDMSDVSNDVSLPEFFSSKSSNTERSRFLCLEEEVGFSSGNGYNDLSQHPQQQQQSSTSGAEHPNYFSGNEAIHAGTERESVAATGDITSLANHLGRQATVCPEDIGNNSLDNYSY